MAHYKGDAKKGGFRKRRGLPRGIHVTVYDIQGEQISPEILDKVVKAVEGVLDRNNAPHLAIDVKTT
jgi:hypothetical protein